MNKFLDVLRTIFLFTKWVVIALIMILLWVWAVQATHAQGVPLVKATHDSFVSYYDLQTHNPALVVYQLEFSHFVGVLKPSGRHFKMDTQLPRPRVKDSDYSNTGYVRGHLCSAADRDSKKSWLKETYLTSNLVPMTMVCNSGRWKAIEDSCRSLAAHGHRLRVGRWPLYDHLQHVIQTNQTGRVCIAIPSGFACAAMCLDCDLKFFQWCPNLRSGTPEHVIQFRNDPRLSILLTNIFGIWLREEYETITH